MSELDEYAQRGRELRERQERAPRRRWRWRALLPAKMPLEREALAGDLSLWLLPMSAVATGIGFGLWFGVSRAVPQPWSELVVVVWSLVALGVMMFVYQRMQRRASDRARAWIAALPFAGNWSAYERALGKERGRAFVHMRVRFEESFVDTEGRRLADAMRGMVRHGKASCNGDTLEVASPELKTYFQGNGDRESRHHNIRVHKWVRRALSAVLRIHGEHPVVRVDVEVRD